MRFKSVFGAFFFIVLASLFAFILFVQTKSFGRLLTSIASDISKKRADTAISIKNIEVSFFPPGLEFNKVRVKKKIAEDESFEAEFGKLGFYINLIEIEEKKLSFGEIRIMDSVIDYKFPKKDDELKEIDQKVIDQVFDLSNKLPVRVDTLLIENTLIIANHELMEAKRLKIFKKDDSFITRFHLSNIKPSADSDFTLDEIWADAEITRRNVNIYRLKIQHDVQSFIVKGKIRDYRLLKNATGEINGESHLHLKNLGSEFDFPEMVKILRGNSLLSFNIKYKDSKLSGSSKISLNDFRSNMFYADNLEAVLAFENQNIILNKLDLTYKKQKGTLKEPAIIANIKTKKILEEPLKVAIENVTLTNALRILGPKFKILRGKLSGDLSFVYDNGDLYFNPENNFIVDDLSLVVGKKEDPFTIIHAARIHAKNTEISVVGGEFRISSSMSLPRSSLEIDGFVNKKEARFHVDDATVNLQDLGNISNLDIKGNGKLSVNVSGPLDDVHINLRGKMSGFEILGYRLGQTDKDITIALRDDSVIINKFEALYRSTPLSGSGVVNYGNKDIALGINADQTTFSDIEQILHPVFSKLDFLPQDLNMGAKIDVDIYGKTTLKDLKIKSDVKFKDLVAYGEVLNSGTFRVEMINQDIKIVNLNAVKDEGEIGGNFIFNLPTKNMKVDYQWENLSLSDFNIAKSIMLNIDGQISGSVKGQGNVNDYVLYLKSKMFNTKSQTYAFEDSDMDLKIMPKSLAGNFNFIGNTIVSKFDISLKPGRKSDIELVGRLDDIKPLATAIFGQHLEQENFEGKIGFNLKSHFSETLHDLDLKASLSTFVITHPEFNVNYHSTRPEFIVENGNVKNWDLSIKEKDLFVTTKGSGKLDRDLSLVNELHVNAKIADILLSPVLAAEGYLRNIIKIDGRGNKYFLTAMSSTDNLNLSIANMPFPLGGVKYALEYSDRKLLVKELSTKMDSGSVSVKGDIFFDDEQPDVNLRYVFDRAEFPILNKSSLNLSGEGMILGNQAPYVINGDIVLNKTQIVNELSDFESKSSSLTDVRYLPKNQEFPLDKFLNLNINIKSENLIRVTNSLMDVGMKGEVRVSGTPARPRGEGKLYSPSGISRIYFKNNEYIITNADLNFTPKKAITNPDFDVQASTFISNYKVYAKAYGDLDKFNFDLSSEPALTRNSILSLIAFGYTDDMQSSLGDQKEKLAGMGVGSFVADRFKISDILNKQFGFQLNLGTVVEQSQTASMLSGRGTQNSDGSTVGRTRSATKIELRKRLDEATSVSVSSTMGSGIGQRQRMDLTYMLNKKVQLQGVYEQRTNQDGEEDIIDKSIGGDLKFRWSFK